MRTIFSLSIFLFAVLLLSCGGNTGTGKTFCDTACTNDTLHFKGDHPLNPIIAIGIKECKADTILWTHDLSNGKMLSLRDDLGQDVYLNAKAMDVYFKDTSYAWLQFADCKTGRGYLLRLPFSKKEERRKVTGAFTKFDPKFSIDPDLVVYTDRGSVFVENIKTSQKGSLQFDKPYDIDFNKLHDLVDSANVTKDRIFVQMIRDGEKKTYEKKVSL